MSKQYKKKIEKKLKNLKNRKNKNTPHEIDVVLSDGTAVQMYVINDVHVIDDDVIKHLADWRDAANEWFPAQFPVTHEGTKRWAKNLLHDKEDRILFFIKKRGSDTPFGHMGLYRFDYGNKNAEIDNVIRGVVSDDTRGAMTEVLKEFMKWTFEHLELDHLHLTVFSDNTRAISLYERAGFVEKRRVPLVAKKDGDVVSWVDVDEHPEDDEMKRFNVTMVYRP